MDLVPASRHSDLDGAPVIILALSVLDKQPRYLDEIPCSTSKFGLDLVQALDWNVEHDHSTRVCSRQPSSTNVDLHRLVQ